MDRSVIDSLDADCGCAGGVNADGALAGLFRGVIPAELDGGLQGFVGLLLVVQFGSEPFDAPRLAGAYQGEDAASDQGVLQHPPTPLR